MLVAGEETKESLSTWPRAAAAQQSSESERVARERDAGGKKVGSGRREADGGKKTHGLLVGRFSVSLKICVFFYFSFSPFYFFYSFSPVQFFILVDFICPLSSLTLLASKTSVLNNITKTLYLFFSLDNISG